MEKQTSIIGSVFEIVKCRFVNIKEETEGKEIACYITKAVAARNQITEIGQRVEISGGNKEFKPGKNYFVIHKIKRLEELKPNYSGEIEKAKSGEYTTGLADYFGDVLDTVLKKGFLKGYEEDPLIEFEFSDTGIKGERTTRRLFKRISASACSCFNFHEDCCYSGYQFHFHASKLLRTLDGINLANKKGGAKFEGKIKIEVCRVKFIGKAFNNSSSYEVYGIDETEMEKGEPGMPFIDGNGSRPKGFKRGELMGWFRNLVNGKKKDDKGKDFERHGNYGAVVNALPYLPHLTNEDGSKLAIKLTEKEMYGSKVLVDKVRITIVR